MKSHHFLCLYIGTVLVATNCRQSDPLPPDPVGTMATGGKIDPKIISPQNNGLMGDLDGDGVEDWILMNGNIVYWKRSNEGDATALLTINLPGMVAYTVGPAPKTQRISIFVYTTNNDEYICENLFTDKNGRPVFGTLENTMK